MPLISVITPVYNKEKYVAKAIESVLSQSFKAFEYIIIDDGSTDRSPAIVDEYAKKDDRIKVIHQKNQWIYASFNNGIRKASGEYIYILNADDRLRKNALELMAEKVRELKPDVIWTKVLSHKADENQNILEYDYARLNDRVSESSYQKNKEEFQKAWLFLNKSLLTLNQANLYKRELMLIHPFRNDVYGADTLFNISIADDISSSYVLREPVYDFFQYSDLDNESAGKYYEYEHRMFNDFYTEQKKLLETWGDETGEFLEYISHERLYNFSQELRNYRYCNTLTTEEKLGKILEDMKDNILYECAQNIGGLPELERRLLFGAKSIIDREGIRETSQFAYLNDLLKIFEAQQILIKKTNNILMKRENSYKIGSCFEKILCEGEIGKYIKFFYGN
ncbi:MAG: glycosyltransferase family 2 protein [Roseburia sp. 1XD42-69]|jgi:Glycosyltransferases involved in cell wall biogenesis